MNAATISIPIPIPIPMLDPIVATSATHDASIVIISFNTREILRECLHSVLREIGTLSVEIFIVDNNSTDGSPEMVEQDFPQAILLRAGSNLGFGAANNLALLQSRGRYFVLLNSDAFFKPGTLAASIHHMDTHPECGLGGARLVGRDGVLQASARTFPTVFGDAVVLTGLAARFPKSKFFGAFDRTWADSNQPAQVDWVPGAFSIIRPAALLKTGLFDPAFFLYCEEVDLCLRIKQAGYVIWYWPDISVIHIGGESSRQLKTLDFSSTAAQVVLWRMRSTLLYYRKHHGWKVHAARWLEVLLNRAVVIRNRFSPSPARQGRRRNAITLNRLMNQAWHDTQRGCISPPRPW